MSEQSNTESAEDDWAAAMAEQASTGEAGAIEATEAASSAAARPASDMFQQYAPAAGNGHANDIDMIMDIPVQMSVELGRTKIPNTHSLQLAHGSVVELDGLAGEPMNVLINGCLIAQGEVVVVNEKFGIRLTDIITPSERIRKLNK